jgi:DNA-binding CsgD family transcriptional regulator
MSTITIDEFSGLVSSIHHAVMNSDEWPNVLARLAHVVGATTGTLVVSQPRSRRLSAVSIGADLAAVARYHEHYGRLDPIVRALEGARVGTVLTPGTVVARAQMKRQEFFVDWAFPSGVGDGIFASVSRDSSIVCSLILAGPVRSEDLATPERVRLVGQLAPHLKQAVQMQAVVEAIRLERDSALDTLDRVPYGIVVLSPEGTARLANRAALEITAMQDGIAVGVHGVRAAARDADASLQALITRISRDRDGTGSSGMVRVRRPSGRRSFVVLAIPCSRARVAYLAGIPDAAGVLIAIVDPDREPRLPAAVLEDLFDLTPAEAAVAIRILSCDGLKAVADSLGVTLSTVRIHLQRVFEKTEVHRQSELVRLLLEVLPVISMQEAGAVPRGGNPRVTDRYRYRNR